MSVSHTKKPEVPWFIWIKTNGSVQPQKWASWWNPIETQLFTVMQKHEITEEEWDLPLNTLAEKYPYVPVEST